MKTNNLKGLILFEKDGQGDLSELLYDPILKIFDPNSKQEFKKSLDTILFSLNLDNIVIKKRLRINLFKLIATLIVCGKEEWSTNSLLFVQEILLTFNPKDSLGIKNFIDLDNKRLLPWSEVFGDGGIKTEIFYL
jgi:phosphomevalonate kinase